ncbi:retrovirus-related pol polyprotein from transposon TNT 1-94 [Tanacetum coccineum]
MSKQMINHVNNWEKANQENTNESVTAELERYKERVKTFEQRLNVDLSTREKMIDSQMDDMIKEKLPLKQQIDSLEQNISNQIKENESLLQTFTVFKNESKEKENKYIDKEIDLENKIKELDNIVYKVGRSQTVHMLTKPQVFYDNAHKQALGYQNSFYLKKAQRIKPTLYDGSVISNKHVAFPVFDDEETLILEEVELSDDQAFWLQTSHHNTDQSTSSSVKIEAPRELPKYNDLLKRYSQLEKHCIYLESTMQLDQEIFQKESFTNNQNALEIPKYFKNNDLKAQLQAKDATICKLKEHIKSMRENDKEEKVKHEMDEIETINIELEHRKETVKNVAQIPIVTTVTPGMFKLDLDPLAPRLLQNREAHIYYLKHTQEQADILRGIESLVYVRDTCPNAIKLSEKKVVITPMNKVKKVRFSKLLTSLSNIKQVVQIVLWYLDSECSKHITGNRSQLMNFVSKFLETVRFENDQVSKIMGYGDYKLGNADLEVAFRKNTYFIRNLEGVDLLSGSRDINLYTISLDDKLKTSPICLLSKASKTKSWLWHFRLSHLNFGTLNKLAKDGLARGIPKLKFQKDHLCSACALGKSKKSSHQPKAEDTNQEKLYLLHMDLCGPMRVESINGKKCILVIVDDYSRFTWVRFLRSKDEAPDAIIKCIKNIQVRLNATVRNVRTDNGTEFVNQTLRDFYENVGISHKTSILALLNRTTLSKDETKIL